MSEPSNKVLTSLHAVMAEIGAIGKTNVNSFQKYNFRSVDQAMSALQPLLLKNRLILQPCYQDEKLHEQEKGFSATAVLNLTFHHVDDGSSFLVRVPGQGADSGDKALYKALAGAFKYAIFQTFCIPESGTDAEHESPEVKPKAKPLNAMKNLGL